MIESMTDKPLTDVAFSNFDLHPALLEGLEKAGFTRCTPIQALTLPLALAGRDIAGQAQTGTGKTLAFLIATIDRLLKRPALATRQDADPRALILAPTRELAIQIHKDALAFGSALGIKYALVYGGVDYDKQREILQRGADIIIATPGRLIDYVKQHKVVSLHACEVCVLDEADRMFDLGFIKDIRFLLRKMPGCKERQTLLFSATLSHRVLELAYEHMNDPEKLVVETATVTTTRVRQKVYFPSNEEKIPLLIGLLSRSESARTMIFVNTKAWVEKVARGLERAGFRVGVISGDVPQKKRESLLNRFKRGDLELLVATDVAARGLHIEAVSHVYNFDLPFDAEDYVHRIGRTARLGAEGDAISFACERYAQSLPEIEAFIEQKIPVGQVDPELLVAIPRAPRAGVPAVEGEEPPESVSQIFREVRGRSRRSVARWSVTRRRRARSWRRRGAQWRRSWAQRFAGNSASRTRSAGINNHACAGRCRIQWRFRGAFQRRRQGRLRCSGNRRWRAIHAQATSSSRRSGAQRWCWRADRSAGGGHHPARAGRTCSARSTWGRRIRQRSCRQAGGREQTRRAEEAIVAGQDQARIEVAGEAAAAQRALRRGGLNRGV